MARRISATKASREFSAIIDAVEHAGDEFVIERHGRPVAAITTIGTGPRRTTWGDLVRALRNAPKPDASFAKDLRRIRRKQGRLPRDPWASSSTRRRS